MKVALVAPDSTRCSSSSLERGVEDLARGLARQGTDVELVTQDPGLRSLRVFERDGVLTRCFPATGRGLGFVSAPGLWEHVRQCAETWDAVHLHAGRGAFSVATRGVAFATRRVSSGRLIFTPHAPIQRLLRWPYAPAVRAVVERAASIVALSGVEADLIRDIFPRAGHRVQAIPMAVDAGAIQSARALEYPGQVVLADGPMERRTERVIAAMASLDHRFRLVILGGGPAARRLQRYADDLQVSARVDFVGRVSPSSYYRWLRTARVLVTLTGGEPSGFGLLEALTAGASAVACDVAVHREAAAVAGHAGVRFVAGECSPLELADAIAAVAELDVPPAARLRIPSGQAVAECMLGLYRSLIDPGVAERDASANGMGPRLVPRG
jgi:glycosyltransferase involved in cell wall biosynthesis